MVDLVRQGVEIASLRRDGTLGSRRTIWVVRHARVVDDGDLVTGAGVTSGLDLSLYLLEREVGPRIAHAVEELFAHERRGTVWRHQGPSPAGL